MIVSTRFIRLTHNPNPNPGPNPTTNKAPTPALALTCSSYRSSSARHAMRAAALTHPCRLCGSALPLREPGLLRGRGGEGEGEREGVGGGDTPVSGRAPPDGEPERLGLRLVLDGEPARPLEPPPRPLDPLDPGSACSAPPSPPSLSPSLRLMCAATSCSTWLGLGLGG